MNEPGNNSYIPGDRLSPENPRHDEQDPVTVGQNQSHHQSVSCGAAASREALNTGYDFETSDSYCNNLFDDDVVSVNHNDCRTPMAGHIMSLKKSSSSSVSDSIVKPRAFELNENVVRNTVSTQKDLIKILKTLQIKRPFLHIFLSFFAVLMICESNIMKTVTNLGRKKIYFINLSVTFPSSLANFGGKYS